MKSAFAPIGVCGWHDFFQECWTDPNCHDMSWPSVKGSAPNQKINNLCGFRVVLWHWASAFGYLPSRCDYRTSFKDYNCTWLGGSDASVTRESSIVVATFIHVPLVAIRPHDQLWEFSPKSLQEGFRMGCWLASQTWLQPTHKPDPPRNTPRLSTILAFLPTLLVLMPAITCGLEMRRRGPQR